MRKRCFMQPIYSEIVVMIQIQIFQSTCLLLRKRRCATFHLSVGRICSQFIDQQSRCTFAKDVSLIHAINFNIINMRFGLVRFL